MDREAFEADVMKAGKRSGLKILGPIRKAIFAALGERDHERRRSVGTAMVGRSLTANSGTPRTSHCRTVRRCPCQWTSGRDKPNDRLVEAFREDINAYIAREVLPHVPDAWVDYDKTRVGYEIPINRHFYVYKPPRMLDQIEAEITSLEEEIAGLLKGLAA